MADDRSQEKVSIQLECSNGTKNKYVAFISYRHLPDDTKVARQVQRAIEEYRLPKELAHEGNRHLGRCFRDEDELAASSSLPESIQDALTNSGSLIVICSPETRDSKWVQNEIETFIELHGRERIITVLAKGSSEESIPSILRSDTEIENYITREHLKPLAADFRIQKRAKLKLETLRIIAAIIGIDYADLYQRERVRQRERHLKYTIAAVIGAAILAILITISLFAYKDSYVSRAQVLAKQAQEQFERGDRLGAINSALEALPPTENDPLRPVVPELRQVLEEALYLSTTNTAYWHPYYSIETKEPIDQFIVPGGPLLAVKDTTNDIHIYSSKIGAYYLTFDLSEYAGEFADLPASQWKMLFTYYGKTILGCTEPGAPLLCFDGVLGTLAWKIDNCPCNALALSEDEEVIGTYYIEQEGKFKLASIDIYTGNVISESHGSGMPLPPLRSWYPSCMNASNDALNINFGSGVIRFDLQTTEQTALLLGQYHKGNLAIHEDYLVVASYNTEGDIPVESNDPEDESNLKEFFGTEYIPGLHAPYAFASRKGTGDLWKKTGTYSGIVIDSEAKRIALVGYPEVKGFSTHPNNAVVLTAGTVLMVCDSDSGEVLLREDFPSPIAQVDIIPSEERDMLFCLLGNGSIIIREVPAHDESIMRPLFGDQILPYSVYDGAFWEIEGLYRCITRPLDSDNSLVGYVGGLWRDDYNPGTLSYNKLLEKANNEIKQIESFELTGAPHPL